MCYSKNLSLMSFIFGILASSSLIFFGNKESNYTNKAIGYFYMFVSLMQLIEYFLWIDINCVNGFNKLGAILGPILNHLQPLVLLIMANQYLKSNNIIPLPVLLLVNVLYCIYIIYKYIVYISNSSNLCVKTNECNHLDWTWKKDFIYLFYFFIQFINIVNFYGNVNLMTAVIFSYIILIISILKFNQNIGEFWCLIVTGIPFINLFIQKILNINN